MSAFGDLDAARTPRVTCGPRGPARPWKGRDVRPGRLTRFFGGDLYDWPHPGTLTL